MTMINEICDRLVDDWRDFWRWWSVQSAVALGLWNMVPAILSERIPLPLNLGVSAFLVASTVIGRIFKQRTPKGQTNGQQ